MIEAFTWIGFFVATGLGALFVLILWWFAVALLFRCLKETWWIVAWLMHRRGDGEKAKRALESAIRCDERYSRRIHQERVS